MYKGEIHLIYLFEDYKYGLECIHTVEKLFLHIIRVPIIILM